MFKRTIMAILALSLIIPMFPQGQQRAEADASHFTFSTESTSPGSARVVTSDHVDLNGTISNVDPNSITYSIFQIVDDKNTSDPSDDVIGQSKLNSNSNIVIDGSDISIFNVQLYTGLNRITFQGTSGFATVSDTIYIDYRNGPALYNLTANLDGTNFTIKDSQTTVVYSSTSNGKSSAVLTITGNAPNADNVSVEVNGESRTYPVNDSNNWLFYASPVNVKKGKNQVKFTIQNGTQTVVTIRDIAFYNGSVTFYDVNLSDSGSNPMSLETNPNYPLASGDKDKLVVTGTVILPNYYNSGTAKPDPTDPSSAPIVLKMDLDGGASVADTVYATVPTGTTYQMDDPFFIMTFTEDLGAHIADLSKLSFDKEYYPILTGKNEVNIANGTGLPNEGTSLGDLAFSLRNSAKAYIYDINYLPGYTHTTGDSNYGSLAGVDMENTDVFTMPMGVELLIANPSVLNLGTDYSTDLVQIPHVLDANGNSSTDVSYSTVLPNDTYPYVTKTVEGQTQTFMRVIMEIDKLPSTGTQTIQFQLNDDFTKKSDGSTVGNGKVSTAAQDETITLIYGPYVTFNKIYDQMKINYDTTDSAAKDQIVSDTLDNLSGQIFNISNTGDLTYEDSAPNARTVSLYINNTLIDMDPLGPNGGTPDPTKFTIKGMDPDDASDLTEFNKAVSALLGGENTLRISIRTTQNSYDKTLKFYLVPTNLPVIPAAESNGVFPYSTTYTAPQPNDPNFVLNGSIYTTRQAKMNVYGTFDFLDLGTTAGAVSTKTASLRTGCTTNPSGYMIQIVSADVKDAISWNLCDTFYAGGTSISGDAPAANLRVDYDLENQYFSFTLFNQSMPSDGTAKIYNIYVYNNGTAGPRASYRLEIDSVSIPYTIVRPLLPQKSIVNQNYIDVVIYAEGADSVTVGKQVARKVNYDADNDGTIDYPGAFETTVTDLKENRTTTIKFQITRGTSEFDGSFDITYTPTSIPGAQYLEDKMKTRERLFDNQLELDFPSGISLIRPDYYEAEDLKSQVYSNNQILFGIANPDDGVVDRREFEQPPANFDSQISNFGLRFRISFPVQFEKVSPVFWIDPGLADDPNTISAYDPITQGALPYQFPNSGIPSYGNRPANRELVPSKRGTLTLSFDPSIVSAAGPITSVFRYDPVNLTWNRIGGVVNTSKNTITIPFDRFGYYVVGELASSFADVTQHPYARNELEAIYAKGVMNAINSGEFGVDYYITRGEFASMIVRALNIPLNYQTGTSHFDDVPYVINPSGLWDYSYIETAARAGIIRGTLPRIYEPNNYLTREQAAYIIAVALNMKLETNADKAKSAVEKAFKDGDNISNYFQAAVAAIAKKGFISGSPVNVSDPKAGYLFSPKADLTRADAAVIISKVMADQKKLPPLN